MVEEGDEFFPLATVSHRVNATFFVFIRSRMGVAEDGTAKTNLDYSFTAQEVTFHYKITEINTTSPVRIPTDNLVEPSETFNIEIIFSSSPSDIGDLVTFYYASQTITIIDKNSESMCMSFYSFNAYMACISFYVTQVFEYQVLRDLFE